MENKHFNLQTDVSQIAWYYEHYIEKKIKIKLNSENDSDRMDVTIELLETDSGKTKWFLWHIYIYTSMFTNRLFYLTTLVNILI